MLENTKLNECIALSLDDEEDGAGGNYIEVKDEDIYNIEGLGRFSLLVFQVNLYLDFGLGLVLTQLFNL